MASGFSGAKPGKDFEDLLFSGDGPESFILLKGDTAVKEVKKIFGSGGNRGREQVLEVVHKQLPMAGLSEIQDPEEVLSRSTTLCIIRVEV
jgi:hypothetical protein